MTWQNVSNGLPSVHCVVLDYQMGYINMHVLCITLLVLKYFLYFSDHFLTPFRAEKKKNYTTVTDVYYRFANNKSLEVLLYDRITLLNDFLLILAKER